MTSSADVTGSRMAGVKADPTTAAVPAFAYEGYARAENRDVTTDDLKSANVYGRDHETIGSISSLILDKDGQITHAVVDVGGFLGIGARSVSIPFSDLTVLRKASGGDLRIYVDTSKDRLEAMPAYKG